MQLWTQIIGKVRLALTPWVNHSWQVPWYVTARGLGTSAIPIRSEILEMEFDFIGHHLTICTSRDDNWNLPLEPQTVADFYRGVIETLNKIGIAVAINEMPNEIANPIRFSWDRTHAAYDADAAHRFWRVAGATFDAKLGEFILPYDTMRRAGAPDELLLEFLATTYAAAAETGKWERAALDCAMGVSARVRQI